jgi:hypothetical protein
MQKAFDLTTIRMTLRKAVQAGHFTMEMLDTPSPGFVNNTNCDRRTFPSGYEGVQFRNLLRDDPAPREAVQAMPDPKDFDVVLKTDNLPTQAEPLPITLETDGFCPF